MIGLIFQPLRLAEQLLVIGRTTAFRADMRCVADEQFVGRKIRLQLLFHFAQSLCHLLIRL